MIQFQYYPARVKSNKPLGFVSLEYFLKATKHPKNNILDVFEQIAEAEQKGDMKLKSELKQNNLFYFTPCVIVNGYRRYDNIYQFTGLLVLDFDHIPNANEFKHLLFSSYKFIIAAWLSPSKNGVKAIVKIPVVKTVDEFKEYYFGLATELDQFLGFDGSGQNAVLPLFQSYDPELLHRKHSHTWETKGIKINDFNTSEVIEPLNIDVSKDDTQRVINIINSGLENIHDNGHPQLRGLCLAAGGYIAAGYIDLYDAETLIRNTIINHKYLKKGVKGYQRTAAEMIRKGMEKPLKLENN